MLYLNYKIFLTCLFSASVAALYAQDATQDNLIPAQKTAAELTREIFTDKKSTTASFPNFLMKLEYSADQPSYLQLGAAYKLPIPAGKHALEIKYQQHQSSPSTVSVKMDGESTIQQKVINTDAESGRFYKAPSEEFALEGDFTIYTEFKAKADGTLFMRNGVDGKWTKGAKALVIQNGKLIYDVGSVGAITSKQKVTDDQEHYAVVRTYQGKIELYLDGKLVGSNAKLFTKDVKNHIFQVSHGTDFAPDLRNGIVTNVRQWKRSIAGEELKNLGKGNVDKVNTPDSNWIAKLDTKKYSSDWVKGTAIAMSISQQNPVKIISATIQPLDTTHHAKLIKNLNPKQLKEGEKIYNHLCITCHGNQQKEGSLPTAMRFHKGTFKNGSDPYRIFKTLEKGYGMMVPQVQYTAEEKYAVIHYIRETFLKKQNPTQYFNADESYLASLPHHITLKDTKQTKPKDKTPAYAKMDFGPYKMGTFQIDHKLENIAQKGINIRLNPGEGGVSKGNSWMLYDHDTMRMASAYQGEYLDWKGIQYDGSHGTHATIGGTPTLTTPNQPVWRNPNTGDWKDLRVIGRDGRRYGPLPKSWVDYKGLFLNDHNIILRYSVGKTTIEETPSITDSGIFIRQLQLGAREQELVTLLGEQSDDLNFVVTGAKGTSIQTKNGLTYLHIPKGKETINLMLGFAKMDATKIKKQLPAPLDLTALLKGGQQRYQQVITTKGTQVKDSGPFSLDTLTIPDKEDNPWNSWMRLGGFDFFPQNPDRAAICTWLGDVWLVDGVSGDLSELKWKRIATGLFQPLGLKIVDNSIYVTCRDQIAKLHDLNGDEEIDYIESFNHDHQVTEHFHEFAMGLQVDDQGNFYYAKSARHAKLAVVPHHGTLIKITPDGKTSEIIATGFRAANGVCINPDGTWIVTDQEGHWNPKNRINYVKKGGFYGNMYGYHNITDPSDDAMQKPLCWITNSFDRSPAELVWAPKDAAWANLNGTLLNLSYGMGKVYTVPHEIVDGQAQGGMCALPLPKTKSGIHRGRFHPENKQLYGVGMFAWAGNQQIDGGFYRIRHTGKPANMPISVKARKAKYTIAFSDNIPAETTFTAKSWDLKRTKNYGSKHYNEKQLEITKVTIYDKIAELTIPHLTVTRGLEVIANLPNGETRVIHASIHILKEK